MQQSEYKVNTKLKKFTSYLDFLYNWLLPQAILYGMTSDQFWYDEPQLFYSYARSYEMAQERKLEYDNHLAWLSGQYILAAVQQSLATKHGAKIYPKKPFNVAKKEEVSVEDKFVMRQTRAKEAVMRFNKQRGETKNGK